MHFTIKSLTNTLIAVLIPFTLSCSKIQNEIPLDTTYFPTETGSVTEFDVERTIYSLTKQPVTETLFVRQVITDSFLNPDGSQAYKIEYDRHTSQNQWQQDSASILWRTVDKAFVQENGQTIVKMRFPVSDGLAWNGNEYNPLPEAIFRSIDKNKPSQVGPKYYPYTVTIVRQDDSTLLSRNKYIEIYAPNIGLIGTEKVFVKYCSTPDCIGKGIINSGYKEISVLKTHMKK